MAITQLETVSIWDKPPNVSGARCFGYLDQVLSWELTRRLDAAHAATLVAPIEGNANTLAIERRILVLHFTHPTPGYPGEIVPLRISETTRTQGPDGLRCTITARSLLFDWGDAGPISYLFAGGSRAFAISAELTAEDWMAQYALPHLQRHGYDWYMFSAPNALRIPRAFTRETALQLLNACQATIGYEVQVAPAGALWEVALVQSVNAALPPLRVAVGRNLQRLTQTRSTQEQATRLVPVGGRGHSELSRSIQGTVLLGGVLSLPTCELLVQVPSDSHWLMPVVQMDGQYVDPSGQRPWYLQRLRTGRSFRIVETYVGGRFVLADLTPAPAGDLWALREDRLGGTELDVPSPGYPLQVAAPPAGNSVTLLNPMSAADPITIDDQHLDCKVRRSTFVAATTSSGASASAPLASGEVDVTVASTVGVQAGDWGFAHSNAAQPWGLLGKYFTVTQVLSATVVRVRTRYTFDAGVPFTTGMTLPRVRFYRVDAAFLAFVNGESAAANTVALDAATGIMAGDLVEFAQENAGTALVALPSPAQATYGAVVKDREISAARCVPNLLMYGNPVFDDWTGSMPTGWSYASFSNPLNFPPKVTTNLPGPGAVNAMQLRGEWNQVVTSPVCWARPTAGNSKACVRVRVRTGVGADWTNSSGHKTTVSLLAGSLVLGAVVIGPPGTTSGTAVNENTIVDMDVLAVDLLHTPGAGNNYAPWNGVKVQIKSENAGGVVTVGGVMVVQDQSLPEDGFMSDYGNQDLFGLGQLALAEIDTPAETNDVEAFDLARALTEGYAAEELVEGRRVRVEAEALGLAFEDRIASVTYRGAEDGTTQVEVATRKTRFSDVLANYLTLRA